MGVMPNIGPLMVQMTPTVGVITLILVLGVNLGVVISALQHPQKCSAKFREGSVWGGSSGANLVVVPNLGPLLSQMTPTVGVITLILVLGVNLGVVISVGRYPPPKKNSAKSKKKSATRVQ